MLRMELPRKSSSISKSSCSDSSSASPSSCTDGSSSILRRMIFVSPRFVNPCNKGSTISRRYCSALLFSLVFGSLLYMLKMSPCRRIVPALQRLSSRVELLSHACVYASFERAVRMTDVKIVGDATFTRTSRDSDKEKMAGYDLVQRTGMDITYSSI